MMKKIRKCLVIGLDGATFRVMKPMFEEGELPNLARLSEKGATGVLQSPPPAATFPTWATFMTGVNPGEHGIFDFTRMVPGRYEVQFVNSTFLRKPTLWKLLSERGRRVVSLGIPGTYPPEPVNGVLIAGFDSPVTTRLDGRFVYPRELHKVISRKFGPYPVADIQELHVGPGWHERARRVLLDTIATKREIGKFMMEREEWDFFMIMFGESDTSAHHFWMFHDPDSPRREGVEDPDRFSGVLREVYTELDRAVGELIEAAGRDVGVVVLSDHGFGGSGSTVLYINRWLASQGFLTFKRNDAGSGASFTNTMVNRSKELALRWMPSRLQEFFFRFGGGLIPNRIESAARFGGIDWERTKVYSEELNYAPALRINLSGREPNGIVPPQEKDAVIKEVISTLMRLKNPFSGERVVKAVLRREDVYRGNRVEDAPDLLLELALERHGDGDYSYNCLPSLGKNGPVMRKLEKDELLGAKGAGMNGSHRKDGVFFVMGDGVREGVDLGDVRMEDAAPTIFSLMGEAVPEWFEGKVPGSLFEDSAPTGKVSRGEPVSLRKIEPLSEEDQEAVRKRLAGMGYLDDREIGEKKD